MLRSRIFTPFLKAFRLNRTLLPRLACSFATKTGYLYPKTLGKIYIRDFSH